MNIYLLVFGIFITIVFLIGVFYTIGEFNEIDRHPEDYQKDHPDMDAHK